MVVDNISFMRRIETIQATQHVIKFHYNCEWQVAMAVAVVSLSSMSSLSTRLHKIFYFRRAKTNRIKIAVEKNFDFFSLQSFHRFRLAKLEKNVDHKRYHCNISSSTTARFHFNFLDFGKKSLVCQVKRIESLAHFVFSFSFRNMKKRSAKHLLVIRIDFRFFFNFFRLEHSFIRKSLIIWGQNEHSFVKLRVKSLRCIQSCWNLFGCVVHSINFSNRCLEILLSLVMSYDLAWIVHWLGIVVNRKSRISFIFCFDRHRKIYSI